MSKKRSTKKEKKPRRTPKSQKFKGIKQNASRFEKKEAPRQFRDHKNRGSGSGVIVKNTPRPASDETQNPRGGVVIVKGPVQKNKRGFAFLLHKPEDIFIPPEYAAKLLSGDTAKVWLSPGSKEILKIQVLEREIKSFIGNYYVEMGKHKVELEEHTMKEYVLITTPPQIKDLKPKDKVLVEITRYEPQLEGRIIRSFGPTLAPKFDTFSVVVRSNWPQEFSKGAVEVAERLSLDVQKQAEINGYKGRKDHRKQPFITIDGADARDFDDAICIEKTASGYVLYVAIADVAAFVELNSVLDQEAYGRATSVYFPEWVIPMLPEALSNGACSLRPDEDKLTLTCEMHFDFDGKKKSKKVYESVIRSHRRCIYENVQKEFEAGDLFWKVPYELFALIKNQRKKRGSIDLDLPEAKVVLDAEGNTIDIKKVDRKDSHRLIEEFMIVANESVSELMESEGWPFIYRVHEPPQAEALKRFEKLALALGYKAKLSSEPDPKIFSSFLENLRNDPMSMSLHYFLLRSLKQARYEPINLKHFGLASKAYSHFTSPIRRYPDLMVHRILKKFVNHQGFKSDQELSDNLEYLSVACDHCSKQERKAEDLDRKVVRIKKARFMDGKYGENFEARVTNISENGLYVELGKFFVEGLVPIAELGNDYFEFIEEKIMLKGKRSGMKFLIGSTLNVQLLRVNLDQGHIDFTLQGTKN